MSIKGLDPKVEEKARAWILSCFHPFKKWDLEYFLEMKQRLSRSDSELYAGRLLQSERRKGNIRFGRFGAYGAGRWQGVCR